jgi:hypothetical protein
MNRCRRCRARADAIATLRTCLPNMSASLLEFRPEASHWEPKFPFDLVVAYEDETSRNRALALSDRLAADLRDDHDLQSSWWRLDFLQHPQLLERAVDAAVNANMILVSLRQSKELPFPARAWLDSWIERKDGHNCALVALLEGAAGRRETCPVLSQLHSAARRAQMSFFSHLFPPPGPAGSVATLNQRETTVTALLQGILRHRGGVPRWGINE